MKSIYEKQDLGPEVPRLALKPDEAAEALGMCRSTLDKNTAPRGLCIPAYRIGTRLFYPITPLEEWQVEQVAKQQEVRENRTEDTES